MSKTKTEHFADVIKELNNKIHEKNKIIGFLEDIIKRLSCKYSDDSDDPVEDMEEGSSDSSFELVKANRSRKKGKNITSKPSQKDSMNFIIFLLTDEKCSVIYSACSSSDR